MVVLKNVKYGPKEGVSATFCITDEERERELTLSYHLCSCVLPLVMVPVSLLPLCASCVLITRVMCRLLHSV